MVNGTIQRKVLLPLLLIPAFILGGCAAVPKEDDPEYSIVGTWGMVSGLYQNSNGTSVRYEKLLEGMYYTRYEFKENGILIQTQHLGVKLLGKYEYDAETSTLTFGWEPYVEMYTASVVFADEDEMTITTEGSLGVLKQNFVKIANSH